MATSNVKAQSTHDLDSRDSSSSDVALQMFGGVSAGQKAGIRMQVHGGFSYLYIPFDGTQLAEHYLRKLAVDFDKAVNVSTHSAKKLDFQHNISVITCTSFGLLLRGAAMNKSYQSHEFHIPYPLQVKLPIGHHLRGLNTISIAARRCKKEVRGRKCGFRSKSSVVNTSIKDVLALYKSPLAASSTFTLASESSSFITELACVASSPVNYFWHEENTQCLEKSTCQMEVQVVAADVMNECKLTDTKEADVTKSDDEKQYVNKCLSFLRQQRTNRLTSDTAEFGDTWNPDDLITNIDIEDDSDDDAFLIPQFDGASDKMSGSDKKSDQNQIPATGAVGRGMEKPQSYSPGSWTQQDGPQESGSVEGPWHGHSRAWLQQQHYQSWLHYRQHMPSAFPTQKAQSFQSPSHNPYASPTHQQPFQTPSPSQHQYQYPPYQSPPSSQPYQSPSQLPYQSPQSNQTFHSPQSVDSSFSHQPYQSPSTNQSYQSLEATSQPYQSPIGNQPYQSPSFSYPFQSSQGDPYQPASVQRYPSNFQSSFHSHQASHPQPHSHPYQSPSQEGSDPAKSAWSPQSYSGDNQGHISSHGTHPESSSERYLVESSEPSPDVYGQPVSSTSGGQGSFFSSQCVHQQELTNFALSAKPVGTHGMAGSVAKNNQFDVSQPHKKSHGKKEKDNMTPCEFRPSQSPCISPAHSVASKSPVEIKSTITGTPPFTFEAGFSLLEAQDQIKSPHNDTGDIKSIVPSSNTSSATASVTHISMHEIEPVTSCSAASVDKTPSIGSCIELLNSATSSSVNMKEVEVNTSTPMIQQLLMEEQARMSIRKEVKEAVMKKPIANPGPPKPKRKYRKRVDQCVIMPKRPRSTSLSSPVPPMVEYCEYSPQPIGNSPMIGQPGRSHSVTLPFSSESRMPSPLSNYGCQQWNQQSLSPSSRWQEQQHQWHNFGNSGDTSYSTPEKSNNSSLMVSGLQHRSFSVNAVQSPTCLQLNQNFSFSSNQNAVQNSSDDNLQTSPGYIHECSNREHINDKSSLSSLFQLVSNVGSSDTSWKNATVSVMPNLYASSNGSETPISIPVSDLNLDGPSVKDVITLETCKQECENINSPTADMMSSKESALMDIYFSGDLKLESITKPYKPNRMKPMALLQTQSTYLGSAACTTESNPAYNYTFHVPTPVFKKLKFFNKVESRKHNVKLVRMHPMDARRYSLLKIGSEIVKANKLSEHDLANYNGILPLPSHFESSNDYTNRVNLDIPTVSADKQHAVCDNEEMFSKFDMDFQPNKVAPPSSFNASPVSASMASHSPVDSNWGQQYTSYQPVNYEGITSRSQQAYNPHQGHFPCAQEHGEQSFSADVQQMLENTTNKLFGSQLPVHNSIPFQQFNLERHNSCPHSAPSSIQDISYPDQQGLPMNHPLYQQQQLQQQQECSSGSHQKPKNGLRSPGQHGPASRIESRRVYVNSGDLEVGKDENITKSSHFNTRVNAYSNDNHAEHMAGVAAGQHTIVCSSSKQSVFEQPQSAGHNTDDDSTYHNVYTEQLNSRDKLDEKQQTLKTPGENPLDYSLDVEDNVSVLSENGDEDLSDEVADSKYTLEKCGMSEKPVQLAKFRKCNADTLFILQHDKRRGRLSCRKNIKALSLTIPKPHTYLNPLGSDGIHTPPDLMEKDCALSSQIESDDSEDDVNCKDASAVGRSKRSSTLEKVKFMDGGRHSPRQAKLHSLYSECLHGLKPKKQRKSQEDLIEGIHYIVVGKFKGHQAMLVKVKKLNVNPTERVRAEKFEKLAAKEVVRVVSPVNSLKGRVYDEESEFTNYLSSTAESQSDTETQNPHFECENPSFDQHASFRSRSSHRPSRGRSMPHVKFRSTQDSSVKHGETVKARSQSQSVRNEIEPKKALVGSTSGASENNVQNTNFVHDNFFFRFKQNFIRHFRIKKQAVDSDFEEHENMFFEGIRRSSFHNFQQKFMANIQKQRSGDYSSSSDDEDDVLDETVLKEKIGISQKLEAHQLESKVTPCRLVKHEHFITNVDVRAAQPAVHDKVGTFSDLYGGGSLQLGDPKASKNGHENMWSRIKENGSYAAKDSASNSYKEGTSCSSILRHSVGWNKRLQEKVETEKGTQSLKDNNNVEYEEGAKLVLKNMKPSTETDIEACGVHQQNCPENSMLCSVTDSSIKDEEDKEDYLKCQMAFFEDISSDSDTSDTIIMDRCVGKENVFQGDATNLYVPLSLRASCPGKYPTETTVMGIPTQEHNRLAVSNVLVCKHTEQNQVCCSDLRYDGAELPQVCESKHSKSQVCRNEQGVTSQILDKSVTQISNISALEFAKDSANVSNLTDQPKDASYVEAKNFPAAEISPVSEDATIELDKSASTSARNSGKCVKGQLDTSKLIYPLESETVSISIGADHNIESAVFADTIHGQKTCRKDMKKSGQVKGSKLAKRTQPLDDGNSICNVQVSVLLERAPFNKNKSLRQRTKAYYTYCADSSEDNLSNSSVEDFATCTSQHKSSKTNRKPKGRGSKVRRVRKLPKVSIEAGRPTREREKGVHPSSRGRRKKPPGGDKLLNSLSLLHMATLANLTDTQSDLSMSETVIHAQNEQHYLQHSDNSNGSHGDILSSTQDQMFSTSPQNSDKTEIPAAVMCSPADKKRWKHTRKRRCTIKDNAPLGRPHSFSQRQTRLKPGSANLISNPPSLSRLVNNLSSSSPVPSNFTFNQVDSYQPEAANPSENSSTHITLQLLETRRAQVNCASFSMKDILKLTTPDDSMDSDSKDGAALVRPPESRRAQVKSTALSMSDLLKLTSVDKYPEAERSEPSNFINSLVSDSDVSKADVSVKNLEMLDAELSPPSSQTPQEATADSCYALPQTTDFITTSCQPQMETLEASVSLISQLAKFSSSPSRPHIKTTEASELQLSRLIDFHNSVSSLSEKHVEEPRDQVSGETSGNETQVKGQMKLASLYVSDSVPVNTISDCGYCDKTHCSGNIKNKLDKDVSEYKATVVNRVEFHQKTDISHRQGSSSLPESSGLRSSLEVKYVSKPVSSLPSCQNTVKDASISTCSSPQNLSHQTSFEALSTSPNDQRRKVVSENVDGLGWSTSTPTAGTISQAVAGKSASASSVTGSEKSKFDSHPAVPSQNDLQSSDPKTPISPVLEIPRISVSSDESSVNEKLSCSNLEPLSVIAKQDNRENHKDVNESNTEKEMKPLHPIQVPPNSQPQVLHNVRNPSLYYPYSWQWPVHTPGSDPAVSPLNLCTTQKSLNNYSPITPTSPASPSYPTQAQCATDLSPSITKGKQSLYSCLKADSARTETKACTTSPGDNARHDYKVQSLKNFRISNMFPSKSCEREQTSDNICRERTPTEPWKVRQSSRIISEFQNHSSSRSKGQFNSGSKTSSPRITDTSESRVDSHVSEGVTQTACDPAYGSLPSASHSENLAGANLKIPSDVVTLDAKLSSRFRKNGGQYIVSESAYWSGDSAVTPDSLGSFDTYQSTFSSYKSSPSQNETSPKMSEAAAMRSNLYGEVSDLTVMSEANDEVESSKLKNVRKLREKFRLSPLMISSLNLGLCDSQLIGLTDHDRTKLIIDSDNVETVSKMTDTSGVNKQPNTQKRRMLNQGQYSQDHTPQKHGRVMNNEKGEDSCDDGSEGSCHTVS